MMSERYSSKDEAGIFSTAARSPIKKIKIIPKAIPHKFMTEGITNTPTPREYEQRI